MNILELAKALLNYDAMSARLWVASFERSPDKWSEVEPPKGATTEEQALAASIVEMMAARQKLTPPQWTALVPPSPRRIFLVKAAEKMPRLRRQCEFEGPQALRRRQFFAPPEFLSAA